MNSSAERNLDPGCAKERPHVDINYPHRSGKLPKKKLITKGGFND